MVTRWDIYRSIHWSMSRILKALDVKCPRAFSRYFGISADRYLYNVLMNKDPAKYRLDNYGYNKEWVLVHKYARNMNSLKDMSLPLEELLHYTAWEIMPINRIQRMSRPLSRYDYILIDRTKDAFDVVYRTLFEYSIQHYEKCSIINRLCMGILKKYCPELQRRHIVQHFIEHNHNVRRKTWTNYYDNIRISLK